MLKDQSKTEPVDEKEPILQSCKHIFDCEEINGELVITNPIAYCEFAIPDDMRPGIPVTEGQDIPICSKCFAVYANLK